MKCHGCDKIAGEVSIKVSRYNRNYMESFGGATHDSSVSRVVDLVDRLYPNVDGIQYLIKLIEADIAGDVPETDLAVHRRYEILDGMREAEEIIKRREEHMKTVEARKRFAAVYNAQD